MTTNLMSRFGGLALLASLCILPVGCAAADVEPEAVGDTSEALTAPLLVATPAQVDFGRTPKGTMRTLAVTIANRGSAPVFDLAVVPPDPYVVDRAVPPDPYFVTHNPPTYLPAGSAGEMIIGYAPRAAGATRSSIDVTYRLESGERFTLRVPVQGEAY